MSDATPLDTAKTVGKFGGGSVLLFVLGRLWTDVAELRHDLRDQAQSIAVVNTVAVSADAKATERKESTASGIADIKQDIRDLKNAIDALRDERPRGRRDR